jgi:hypothetical protein
MVRFAPFLFAVAVLGVGAAPAAGATIFYTDRAAWEAAVSGPVITETYESYNFNDPLGIFFGPTATLGEYQYSTIAGNIFGVNGEAVAFDAPYLTGNYLEWQMAVGGNALSVVVLPEAVKAVGFDFGQFDGSVAPLRFELATGDAIVVSSNADDYAFVGAISTEAFTSFSIASEPFPIIDNVSRSEGIVVTLSEPGTLILLGFSGLVGGIVRRSRRRGTTAH